LAALVAELGGGALQLEAIDHPAFAVLDHRRLKLAVRAQDGLAELREQWLDLVIFEVLHPRLRVAWRQLRLVGELYRRSTVEFQRFICIAREGAVLKRAEAPDHLSLAIERKPDQPLTETAGDRVTLQTGGPRLRLPRAFDAHRLIEPLLLQG